MFITFLEGNGFDVVLKMEMFEVSILVSFGVFLCCTFENGSCKISEDKRIINCHLGLVELSGAYLSIPASVVVSIRQV